MKLVTVHNYNDLQIAVCGEIFIADNALHLDEEIEQNMWALSCDAVFAQQVTAKDLINFVERIIAERRAQLAAMHPQKDATFYLWFDEQAMQLRFNLISSKHANLPFRCIVRKQEACEDILTHFLGAIRDKIHMCDEYDNDLQDDVFQLDVFVMPLLIPQ